MAYILVGSTYIGTGTLPTPVAGYEARDTTTGNLYVSNTSATAWTLIGNANQTNLGLLPLTGGTMTGAIAGASGWAPVDSPNFTTIAKLAGVNLATINDLSTTSNNILTSIQPKITEAVSATSSSISVLNNIAMASGILHFVPSGGGYPPNQSIPLPTFPDGSQASQSNCKWTVGLAGTQTLGQGNTTWWPIGETSTSFHTSLVFSVDPTKNLTFSAALWTAGGNIYDVAIAYLIIGAR